MLGILPNINAEFSLFLACDSIPHHIVLDNYSVHLTPLLENISIILNINLIFLPPYSPDLNSIEDVWDPCQKN